MQTEGNLHQWFKGSKSKDGKGGWVNVVTGGTCASDKPGEGTPKCVSSSKRASMTKAERLSAQRRKKKADPNQQSKTGAAKPTYVKTDSPRKKKKVSEEYVSEAGARVGRKFSMGKVGKQYERDEYGDKINKDGSSPLKKNVDKNPKDDKTPNTLMGEAKSPAWQRKAGKSESGGLNAKGVASYRAANPGSKLKTAVTTKPSKLKKGSKAAKRRKSFCKRMKGMKKKLTSAKTARDPDSRINKSLRKWKCNESDTLEKFSSLSLIDSVQTQENVYGSQEKISEKTTEETKLDKTVDEATRYKKETGNYVKGGTKKPTSPKRKDAALDAVLSKITSKYGKNAIMRQGSKQSKKVKGAKSTAGTGKYKKAADDKKQLKKDAKEMGYGKDTKGYIETKARYGSKENMKKGRGLGT